MLKHLFKILFKQYLNILAQFYLYTTDWVEDLPRKPSKYTIYIIGGRKYPFQAILVCPRKGCSNVISIDVSPEIFPRWKITEHPEGTISLYPSVHLNSLDCNCHYWLREGKIYWAEAPSLMIPKEYKIDSKNSD